MHLLTVKEAAEQTRMSTSWWRQRVFRKDIRFFKIGRRVFVPQSTVDEIFQRSLVEPGQRER